MRSIQKAIAFLFVIIALVAISPFDADCTTGVEDEQNFGVKDGYVYVLPRDGLFTKISIDTGEVVWQSRIMLGAPYYDEPVIYHAGSYTSPIFVDNSFFAIELTYHRLLKVDCETGNLLLDILVGPSCPGVTQGMENIIFCGDLTLVVSSVGVETVHLQEERKRWRFNCRQNVVHVYGYFHIEDSLCLIIARSVKGLVSQSKDGADWHKAVQDPELCRYELVELSCSSGEILSRHDMNALLADRQVGTPRLRNLGKGNDDWLILIEHLNGDAGDYPLLRFDPISKSATKLIDQLNDFAPSMRVWSYRDLGPIAMDNSIFYQVSDDSNNALLVSRNLRDGKIRWKVATPAIETLYTATDERLISFAYGRGFVSNERKYFVVVCRDAATGTVCWKRKIKIRGKDQHTNYSEIKMKIFDNRLYFLTRGYIRALDATDGGILWEAPLKYSQDKIPTPEKKD